MAASPVLLLVEVDLEIDLEAGFTRLHGLGYLPGPWLLFLLDFEVMHTSKRGILWKPNRPLRLDLGLSCTWIPQLDFRSI
jgi:hypothetical protein